MNKDRKIDLIFNILDKHDGILNNTITDDQWKLSILNCLLEFSAIENKTEFDNRVIIKLKGMREMYKEVNHNEVKSVILGLTNMVEREG